MDAEKPNTRVAVRRRNLVMALSPGGWVRIESKIEADDKHIHIHCADIIIETDKLLPLLLEIAEKAREKAKNQAEAEASV